MARKHTTKQSDTAGREGPAQTHPAEAVHEVGSCGWWEEHLGTHLRTMLDGVCAVTVNPATMMATAEKDGVGVNALCEAGRDPVRIAAEMADAYRSRRPG